MKKIVTLSSLMLVLAASSSLAAGGLNLYAGGCSSDVGASSTATFACDVNTGSDALIASVIVPADMPMFTGTSALVDITVNAASLPAWWQTASGQCRPNALSMSFDPTLVATATCADIWAGSPPLAVFALQQGLHGPNTVRMNGGAAITAGQELSIVADGTTELTVARVTVSHSASTGASACAGCNVGACFVLSECYLQQTVPLAQYRVTTPISNVVSYNSTQQICAGATPSQNRTWGAVKGLYR